MAAVPLERLQIVPESLREHVVSDVASFWHHRLWCARCGAVNHGSAWFSEKEWCPSCDFMGIAVDYAAVRRLNPDAPGRTRRGQYVPFPGWTPPDFTDSRRS